MGEILWAQAGWVWSLTRVPPPSHPDQLREIQNGRLAMVAITMIVIEEALTKTPVVALTPIFFKPLYEYAAVQKFFDAAFQVASFRT